MTAKVLGSIVSIESDSATIVFIAVVVLLVWLVSFVWKLIGTASLTCVLYFDRMLALHTSKLPLIRVDTKKFSTRLTRR